MFFHYNIPAFFIFNNPTVYLLARDTLEHLVIIGCFLFWSDSIEVLSNFTTSLVQIPVSVRGIRIEIHNKKPVFMEFMGFEVPCYRGRTITYRY